MLKVKIFKTATNYRDFIEKNQEIRFINLLVDNYSNFIFTYEDYNSKRTAVINEAKINMPILEAIIVAPEEMVLREGDIYKNKQSSLEYTLHLFGKPENGIQKWLLQGNRKAGEVLEEETMKKYLKVYYTKVTSDDYPEELEEYVLYRDLFTKGLFRLVMMNIDSWGLIPMEGNNSKAIYRNEKEMKKIIFNSFRKEVEMPEINISKDSPSRDWFDINDQD